MDNYKLLCESLPIAYQSLDSRGYIILANPIWCSLLGYQPGEVQGKFFGDFMTAESRKKAVEILSKFKAAGIIYNIEFTMLCKKGTPIKVRFNGHIDYDEQGLFKRAHCILQDLPEKNKNTAVEESYGVIFENSLNEIFVFDAKTFKFIKVNRGACQNIGYSQEELSELTPLDIKPELTYEMFMELVEPLLSGTKEIVRFESIHQRKDGSRYYVEAHLQLTTFLSKPAYIAIMINVTQRKEVENRLNLVIKSAELGYWDWDYATGKHLVNDRWLEILGLNRDELDNYIEDWNSRIHPDDKKRVSETIKQSIESNCSYTVEFRMRHKLGHWVWIQGSGAVATYDIDNKSPLRLCGTHQDISHRKKNEEQLRKLSLAVKQSPSLVVITNDEGIIEYVNPKIYETTGYSASEVIGKHMSLFNLEETSMQDYKELWKTIKSGEIWRGTLHNKKKNGAVYWSQESIAPIKDNNNQITHFIAIQEDITEAKNASEQLNYQASHDPLTDLINRREFESRVDRTIETAKSNNSVHILCYLDLDQFKIINDTCTHVAGDELLKQFANILRGSFRHRDTVGRLGGDEFSVLLEHCSIQQAERHAQELLTAVNNFQFHWDNKSFRVGVSIGIVAINSETKDTSAVLSSADVACYSAKHAGRNCIHTYQASDENLALDHKEIQWISRINKALNDGLFVLYVQPICQLKTSGTAIDHYEVLLRLQESNGDVIIPPGAFLPAVERFNLSLQLDQWVIKSVFDWIKKALLKNIKIPFLSINLSGQNLGNQQLLAFINGLLESSSQQVTNKICFEITESAAINNLTDAKVFISELREQGVKFSLDDFGSGLSSFNYLKNLPVDFLKIDGQFVKNIANDAIDQALVRSINEIGHVMGKKTIAEFVENELILEILTELGVDYVQGYHLGKPQPINTLLIKK